MPTMHRTPVRALVTLAAVLALAGGASTAGAQLLAELQPGARVRVRAPGVVAGRLTGVVIGRTPDTLVIAREKAGPLGVPIAALTTVDVSRGESHSRGALKGTLWGGGIGLLAGAFTAAFATDSTVSEGERVSDAETVVGSTLGGALLGVAIGAAIGSERWEAFDLPARVGVVPWRGGVALQVTLRR